MVSVATAANGKACSLIENIRPDSPGRDDSVDEATLEQQVLIWLSDFYTNDSPLLIDFHFRPYVDVQRARIQFFSSSPSKNLREGSYPPREMPEPCHHRSLHRNLLPVARG